MSNGPAARASPSPRLLTQEEAISQRNPVPSRLGSRVSTRAATAGDVTWGTICVVTGAPTLDGFPRRYNVRIATRDGVELAADVTPPLRLPAPAVLVHTPYGRFSPRVDELSASYAAAGYAFVVSDVRGRGDSGGDEFVPYRYDGKDGADVIAWIAAQDWCSGEVVTWGGSYVGRAQW